MGEEVEEVVEVLNAQKRKKVTKRARGKVGGCEVGRGDEGEEKEGKEVK